MPVKALPVKRPMFVKSVDVDDVDASAAQDRWGIESADAKADVDAGNVMLIAVGEIGGWRYRHTMQHGRRCVDWEVQPTNSAAVTEQCSTCQLRS